VTFECKLYCQHCVVCKRAKPNRKGGDALQTLGVLHGKLMELPTSLIFLKEVLMVTQLNFFGCRLTKMAHFVPCHKEITAKDSANLFTSNCYRFHGVPKLISSDRDSKFVGKCWQRFMQKLNIKLNMSTAQHHRSDDGLPKRVSSDYANVVTMLLCRVRF